MANQTWSPALLAKVSAAVDAENAVNPHYQQNGGTPMKWPFVALLCDWVQPGGAWTPKRCKDRYLDLRKSGGIDGLAASVEWPTLPAAVRDVMATNEAPAGPRPAIPGVTVDDFPVSVATASAQPAVPAVQFPDLKTKPAPGWASGYLDAIIQAQSVMHDQDTTQTTVPVVIPELPPYATTFSGDWHIGGRGTDHRLLKEYFYLWRRLKGNGVIGMGDYGELFLGKLAAIGVQEHVMPPDMQIAACRDLIESELRESLIALLLGNHDGFTGIYANFVQELAARLKIPFLGRGGEIHLTVGQVLYRIAAWHRYPGAGAVNKGNNQRRASVDHNGPDVTALAHLHHQYGELSRNGEVDQVRCRSGALKVSDDHSRDAAGNIFPDTRMPMVIFHPSRKSMLYFDDFRTGIEPLMYFRKRWHRHPDWLTDPKWLDHLIETGD
ncbi:MAG TPA: hypothetical protein VGK74_02825 [Symbiobacteriaceae bacterium]